MADFRVRVEGLDDLLRRADPRAVEEPIRRFLVASALEVEGRAKENAPVDTGRLRSSITHRVELRRAFVGTNVQYAPKVEFGQGPHDPGYENILAWVRRKNRGRNRVFGTDAEAKRAAHFITRAIRRAGTKAQPFLGPALTQSRGTIQRFLERAGREIEQAWRRG